VGGGWGEYGQRVTVKLKAVDVLQTWRVQLRRANIESSPISDTSRLNTVYK